VSEGDLTRRAARHRALGDPHRLAIVDALRLSDRTPTELAEVTGLGSNLVAFHLRKLEVAERIPHVADWLERRDQLWKRGRDGVEGAAGVPACQTEVRRANTIVRIQVEIRRCRIAQPDPVGGALQIA
jgi:DNA-binding transcriptional ArsR family regulator